MDKGIKVLGVEPAKTLANSKLYPPQAESNNEFSTIMQINILNCNNDVGMDFGLWMSKGNVLLHFSFLNF
jgi:hypothetical protein